MEQHLNNLYALLDKANKAGAFSLQETEAAIMAFGAVRNALIGPPNQAEPKEPAPKSLEKA